MSPTMREDMQRKQEALHAAAVPAELGGPHLPEELHVYHSFVPLEPQPSAPGQPSLGLPPGLAMSHLGPPGAGLGALGEPSKVFGYRSHLYKAICTLDGKTYVLRRLEGAWAHVYAGKRSPS